MDLKQTPPLPSTHQSLDSALSSWVDAKVQGGPPGPRQASSSGGQAYTTEAFPGSTGFPHVTVRGPS